MIKSVALLVSILALVAVSLAAESDVLVLTEENFDAKIQEHPHILVEFYAPWCGHCKQLAPVYDAAAAELKKNNVGAVLAKIDCDTHKNIGNRFGIQGFPTLKWFANGKPSEYKGGRTQADIVGWVSKRLGPIVTPISSAAEFTTFTSKNEFSIVAFADADSELAKEFAKSAEEEILPAGIITDAAVATELRAAFPSLLVYRPEILPHQSRSVTYDGEITADAISKFTSSNTLSIVTEFSPETAQKIFNHQIKTQVLLFTAAASEVTPIVKEKFTAAAGALSGKGIFVMVDTANKNVLEYFGLTEKDIPNIFLVHASEGKSMKKYAYKGEITTESVVAFVNDFHEGKLKAHLKSAPVPETNDGPVKIIVGSTFDELVINSEADVLVEFYAPWCGHCKKLEPIFDKLGKDFAEVKSVVIAKMDATASDPPANIEIQGFPTLFLFPANDKANPIPFAGSDRTAKALKKFIKEHASIPYTLPKKSKKSDNNEL